MFDAVLNRHTKGPTRWGRGMVAAAALHGIAFGAVIFASLHGGKAKSNDAPVITFFAPAPPPPPPTPPPAGGGAQQKKTKVEKKIEKKPDTIVQSKKNEPIPDPPKEEKKAEKPEPAGVEGGVVGGVAGGVVGGTVGGVQGGTVGGVVGGTGTSGVVPFGAGMTRPSPIGADEIQYTREAREARVEGLMIVKCVITTEGTLQNCRVIKGLPMMDKPVLDALGRHRGSPVTFQGHPVSVDYTFNIRLKMP